MSSVRMNPASKIMKEKAFAEGVRRRREGFTFNSQVEKKWGKYYPLVVEGYNFGVVEEPEYTGPSRRMNPRVKGAKDTYKRERRTGEQLFQAGFEDAREGLPAMSKNKHYVRGYKSKSGTNFKARKHVPGAAKRKAMIAAEDARYAASIAKERAVGAAYRKKHPVVYDDRETFHHEYAVKPIWDVPVTRSVSPRTGMVDIHFPDIVPKSKRRLAEYKARQKRLREEEQDFYRYNPIRHITKAGRGRPTTAWWILDLYSARGKKLSTKIGQGSKAKSTAEAKSFINKSEYGTKIVKVELSGPYARRPTIMTKRR